MTHPLLSYLVFWPFLVAFFVVLIPNGLDKLLKLILTSSMAFLVVLALILGWSYDPKLPESQLWNGYQLVEKADWITINLQAFGTLSVDYILGVDGINLCLIMLSAVVLFVAGLGSWKIEKNVKGYVICFLLMAGGILGCFAALDFFLFFIFFEFLLLPMFFLIGIWGGENREYASVKFFLYTLAGSVLILMTMVALYMSMVDPQETALNFGLMKPGEILTNEVIFEIQQLLASGSIPAEKVVHTFAFPYLSDSSNLIPHSILSFESTSTLWGQSMRTWGFLALLVGFLIKLPAVPFHTWLPDAHVEAPTTVSVVLAGLLLKVGAYGLLRLVLPIFPEMWVQFAPQISIVGLVSLIYAALIALGSTDLKKMIAYSSVSHMGYILIGISALTAEGLNGALFQTVSHGLISPLLFILVGVLYDRTHNRNRDAFGGLMLRMPYYVVFFMLAFFASMGIPGFSGFIAEVLVIVGAFKSAGFNQIIPRWVAILSTSGLFLSAAYYLYTARKVFFGTFWVRQPEWDNQLKDLTLLEYALIIPLLCIIILLGVWPGLVLDIAGPAIDHIYSEVQGK